jgi:uncharacterized membrane protein YgcG
MKRTRFLIAAALVGAAAALAEQPLAQQPASPQPQTLRLRDLIEKLDGHTVLAKSAKGEELKLNLADKVLVVAVVKASAADIKEGLFIGRALLAFGAQNDPGLRLRMLRPSRSI